MTTIANIIATATVSVGDAHRDASGIGYYAFVPYYDAQPSGPSREIRAGSYAGMLALLRARKAAVALALAATEHEISGDEWSDACSDLYNQIAYDTGRYEIRDWRSAVRTLVRKFRIIH